MNDFAEVGEVKKFIEAWKKIFSFRMKERRISYCTIPRETWMADLKKASDYCGDFQKKPVEGKI